MNNWNGRDGGWANDALGADLAGRDWVDGGGHLADWAIGHLSWAGTDGDCLGGVDGTGGVDWRACVDNGCCGDFADSCSNRDGFSGDISLGFRWAVCDLWCA